MKRNLSFYVQLFKSTLYISAFTFGGGYVIIPLMKKKFVEEYKWVDEKEMLNLTAIAQSSPGAMAVNAAILIGYRLAGMLGALLTMLGTILPPLIILSILSIAYSTFIENAVIRLILKGMQVGVAAVVLDVSITMILNLIKDKKIFPIIIMIGAFVATFFLHVNAAIIILVCGIIGAVLSYKRLEEKQ